MNTKLILSICAVLIVTNPASAQQTILDDPLFSEQWALQRSAHRFPLTDIHKAAGRMESPDRNKIVINP